MKITRILTSLLLALGVSSAAYATFPVRRTLTHTQPGGTTISIEAVGNGRYTLYTTADGHAALRASDGHFYYATLANGTLQPSATLVGNNTLRSAHPTWITAEQATELLEAENPQTPLLRPTAQSHTQSLNTSTADGLGTYGTPAKGIVSSMGSPTLPVIMVNFADRAFQDTITVEKVSRFFNEKGYRDESASRGSVRDYFIAQSDSLFQPTFKVVAHVTLPNGYAYYGKDSQNGSTDPNALTFVKDALAKASEVADFSEFRTEGTTNVPIAIIMFAGPGQQSSFEADCTNYLWAKFSQLNLSVNGGASTVQSYFMGNELLQSYTGTADAPVIVDSHMDGIALFCHEFSHALGLPDFYDTTGGQRGKTMNYWDLMDYGQYYQNGYRPVQYTAYERSYMGWLHVEELGSEARFCTLLPTDGQLGEEQPRAYLIRNTEDEKEYYMLENRAKNTWNTSTIGTGLFITHVTYQPSSWTNNRVNTSTTLHRMEFVPADNVNEGIGTGMTMATLFQGYRNDLFPYTPADGSPVVDSFTDDTTPAATLYNNSTGKLSRPIYNIAKDARGVITFSYLDKELTGISSPLTPENASRNAKIFDLNGRVVKSFESAGPGIYIVNGKKVIK